jgi:hypothetical protein
LPISVAWSGAAHMGHPRLTRQSEIRKSTLKVIGKIKATCFSRVAKISRRLAHMQVIVYHTIHSLVFIMHLPLQGPSRMGHHLLVDVDGHVTPISLHVYVNTHLRIMGI